MKTPFSHRVKLRFVGLNEANAEIARQALLALGSIDDVEIQRKKGLVSFQYDASQQSLDDCLALLETLDIPLYRGSIWWRWKVNLAFQLDANIRANAKHVPHCCGKPPSGPRR